MRLLWPLLLVLGRGLYLAYALWCLLFPLALLLLAYLLATTAQPSALWWTLAGVAVAFAVAVLALVYARRTADDPNPFQSAVMAWFGTLRWYGNTQPSYKTALGLPSGFLVENPGAYRMGARQIRAVLASVQPGDILLRGYWGYVDGALIRRTAVCTPGGFVPGRFTHAALYVGPLEASDAQQVPPKFADAKAGFFATGPHMVVHAMAKGVHAEDLLTFCRCDYLAVLRIPPDLHPKRAHAIAQARAYALQSLGRDYDFDSTSPTRYQCAELVLDCYAALHSALGLAQQPHGLYPLGRWAPHWAIATRNTVTPDDYFALVARGTLQCMWQGPVDP